MTTPNDPTTETTTVVENPQVVASPAEGPVAATVVAPQPRKKTWFKPGRKYRTALMVLAAFLGGLFGGSVGAHSGNMAVHHHHGQSGKRGGSAQNGSAQNGSAQQGDPGRSGRRNNYQPNGAPANGTAQNGAPANGTAQNGTAQNGAPANGAPANGTAQNGAPANGTAQNGAQPSGRIPNVEKLRNGALNAPTLGGNSAGPQQAPAAAAQQPGSATTPN